MFGIAYFFLALLFTVSAAKGILAAKTGLVPFFPALAAIILIALGVKEFSRRK